MAASQSGAPCHTATVCITARWCQLIVDDEVARRKLSNLRAIDFANPRSARQRRNHSIGRRIHRPWKITIQALDRHLKRSGVHRSDACTAIAGDKDDRFHIRGKINDVGTGNMIILPCIRDITQSCNGFARVLRWIRIRPSPVGPCSYCERQKQTRRQRRTDCSPSPRWWPKGTNIPWRRPNRTSFHTSYHCLCCLSAPAYTGP